MTATVHETGPDDTGHHGPVPPRPDEQLPGDQLKDVVRTYLAGYVSGGDRAVAEALVAEDVEFTSPYSPQPVHGRDEFCALIEGLRASIPDLRIEETDCIAEGDTVAARWTARGTHTGADMLGRPASGRRFDISGMSFYRLRDGRIAEGWVNDDNLGMLAQLGFVAPPAPPAG